ncbi:protein ANTAGONIST OF LIKE HETEROCHROMATIN PROTEIN 1-like [Lolium rigidum]|uniref:protein ANTAGONIST OF LIKE HETEROCHROMATIN PROTEIN 1-like n=1 Tax=Lolium rigidum TaxID=89674 RepID=UPI001F5D1E58|nr:protein ANTAGONIST OF LIKE HETEROCHROMATIN PROTEIN 1-like [Lolium rigidum]
MPNRRRKRGAGEDPPPPPLDASSIGGAVLAADEDVKKLTFPITTILASLAAAPRRRALPFLELNKGLLPEEADDEGEAEVVSPLTDPADGPTPPPAKRPRAADEAASAPPQPQHQRRLWVKDRSSEWWELRSSPAYPDADFRRDFRMGRATFAMVCDALGAAVAKEDTALRTAIPVPQRVAVCVWRLATGEPLRLVSKRFGIGISTCHKLVLEVCGAIRTILMPRFLQWPTSPSSSAAVKASFEAASGVPDVLGAMYTTHVPIIAPKVSVSAYFNRRHTERNQKTSYSITLQGVVGPDGAFTDVCIGWPGSMSDDQVLDKSALQQRAAAGMMAGAWIVGGGTYPLTDWLLVPYTHQNLTWTQHAFNEKVADLRRVAVDAFRRLKGRWACLQKRTEVKLQDLPVVLGACCVLHNICEARGEPVAPDLLQDLQVDLVDDDEAVLERPVRSEAAAKARDKIAHNLLHRGHAGTAFF